MQLNELDTPALLVDLDKVERNSSVMADYCRRHGLALRPHSKTHKSPWLARKQMESGAIGITVAKVGEAEVMASAGLDNLLLAYPVFGDAKARRLAAVARQARLTVALDSLESAQWVARGAGSEPIGILVEVDLGMRRCGLPPGGQPVKLARQVERLAGLRFDGLLFYPGNIHPDLEGSDQRLLELNSLLGSQLELFEREGMPPRIVSGGSTPSAFHSHRIDGLTEIRPGTYIFNDRNTVEWGVCGEADCALSILTTVVSRGVEGQAVVDGGSKTFSGDSLAPGTKGGFGIVKGFPEVDFFRMNEEHGYLKLPAGISLELGQKLEIIPNHACTTLNMHDLAWGHRQGQVTQEWEIAARGKIR